MAPTPPRRMRSTALHLGIVGALAVSLTACGGTQKAASRYCVDDFDQIVPDAQCLATPVASGSNTRTGSSSRYRYYYGGSNSGGRVTGGSYTVPPSGGNSSSGVKTSGVDTGGFGGGKSSTGGGKSSSSSSSSGGS